jgi:hypothetical protein
MRLSRMTHESSDHDRGLAFDLATLNRRRALLLLGGAGLAATLAGCASSSSATSGTTTTAGTCAGEIPQETSGPYSADGSNGPNVLTESGIVRRR